MAYTLHDEDGELGHGPSVNGLRQLKLFLSTNAMKHPALDMLLLHGATHLTKPLAVECSALANMTDNVAIKSTLITMAADARRAKACVMMSA